MEYVTNLMDASIDPVDWARKREDQGWHLLSVADHLLTTTRAFPHVWVTATTVAMATSHVRVTTAFCNNLMRSPVEVAQAGLMLQQVSGGRFELGLGAGWTRAEIESAGIPYREPGDRAGSFAEAAQVIRSLLHSGKCDFDGKYYKVHMDGLGPLGPIAPPPLVCSVGGPRTIREVTPHADRVELKPSSPATRGGALDVAAFGQVKDEDLFAMIDRVRAIDSDIPLGMFVFCNVGEDQATRDLEALWEGGLYGRFTGAPGKAAEGLAWLEEAGVSRAQISPIDDASLDRLAPVLLA